ncbi:MAG TPA: bifunctional demethylmenaquinone methyltransferase/2-methoxy-6-polyprenyl-1,4-benzoquinol methylase, partial [Sphingobacterium sp.]|nr:bifunctional demethylmenaquinone methyltransferase/2-methoxy-6-polyprenyl-1,4-benzoquinol methylase [Sphingobacterium sp.]
RFPDGEKFAQITKAVGFSDTVIRPQTFGVCTIYIATK